MGIRKEQALFLLTAAFGVWMYSGISEVKKAKPVRAKEKEYALPPGLQPITVETEGPKNLRELFNEPSESSPLPPREDLPFPPLRDLPMVLLPLEMGQQPAAYYELRRAPFKAEPNANGEGNGDGRVPAPDPAPAAAGSAQDPVQNAVQDDPSRRYDRLVMSSVNKFWGLFLGSDEDKYRLASRPGPYMGEKIRFQWIDPKTGRTVGSKSREEDGADVARLELAKTLRNEVGLRLHQFRPDTTNTGKQRELIHYLLDKARIEPWVYEKALDAARVYMKFARPREEGFLYMAKVLRAMGDLPAEYDLFRQLDKDDELRGSSFQLRGLGMVEARLGLDKLAEQHLEKAVAINEPIDPRNYAALATFYLDRGRARKAVEPARKAVDFKGRRDPSPEEQAGFQTVLVRALLAVGDLAAAADQAQRPLAGAQQYVNDYQNACVAYAKQDHAAAQELFQSSYNSGRLPDALLGVAACQLAQNEFGTARTNFQKVVDELPRLRHLGLAGLGLSFSASQGSDAIEKIEAALVTYPDHPYILYLLGRQRRLNGDLEAAVEPLQKALRLHDEFLEALAELSMTYYTLFQKNQDAQSLVSALKYIDRLVKLDQSQGAKESLFLEMQGKLHYEARDARKAREAFLAGEAKSRFCQIGLAMLQYTAKRFDQAEPALNRLIRDLAPEDPYRKHAEHLLTLMVRHANKEQVFDRFDRKELGRTWTDPEKNGFGPELREGELRMTGTLRKANLPVVARRIMYGPGRFIELSIDMKVATSSTTDFAGVAIEIPGRGTAGSRFRLRVGMDDRGEVVLELQDGRAAGDPVRTGIRVTRDQWHTIVISVADADDADLKDNNRFLKVYFDGRQLVDPANAKLKSLRRSDNKTNPLNTELRVEGGIGLSVDVAFDNYRRIQEKAR